MDHVLHCTLPIHPRTGLTAVGLVNGRPVWPILGGAPEGETGSGSGGDGSGGSGGDGTATYTPPASQADLDRIVQDRVRRATAKYSDYDEIKTKAEKHDALELELGSAADKAAATARQEERSKANSEWTPRVVKAEFKAAAKGVLTDDQLTALLEDLDLSKYVTDKGDVDEDKVSKKVTAFGPVNGNGKTTPPLQFGQGNHQQVKPAAGEAGRAMAEKRFGKRAD